MGVNLVFFIVYLIIVIFLFGYNVWICWVNDNFELKWLESVLFLLFDENFVLWLGESKF